jgi:hypothetical protein
MSVLVLLCLSVDVCIGVVYRQTKQHQYRHQQINKTTSIKTSTDRQNNTNTDINRQTKQHQ